MADDPFGWLEQAIDGRYRAVALAGEGGFGVVYRGHHLTLDVPVAIKCLKVPQSFGPEQRDSFAKRFAEEARVLHRLSRASAAVVQALDVGAATSPTGAWTPYIVLEWLEGRSLEDEILLRAKRGRRRWPIADAVELLTPAARALAEAHAQRVAHRDIKPANLFLAQVGNRQVLKVLDFGIAKVIHDSLSRTDALKLTGQAIPAFTPSYGAPEQFDRKKGATGPWTDVHALALTLVELISGRPALDGDDVVQLMTSALDRDERPTPRARGVEVDDELESVLSCALALMPEDRYPDAGAFWSDVLAACPEARAALGASTPNEIAASLLPSSDAETARSPTVLDGRTSDGTTLAEAVDSGLATTEWMPSGEIDSRRANKESPVVTAAAQLPMSSEPPLAPRGSGEVAQSSEPVVSPTTRRSEPAPARGRWLFVAPLAIAGVGLFLAGRFAFRETRISTSNETASTADKPGDSARATASAPASSSPTSRSSSSAMPDEAHTAAPIASVVASAPPPSPSSSSAAPTASAPAPAASASAAKSSDEVLAPPDYCEASCKVDGECTATLIGRVVVCRASSDAECKKSYGCTVHGACWARSGRCVALSVDDCTKSLACKQTRHCFFRKGKCLDEEITDCTKYPICKELGMCTARDNACWATSDAHCKASNICARTGACRANGKQCVQ
jgi:serine/threonine-protein kinase